METSQNFPSQKNLTLPDNIDPRIPHIVEQRLSGKSWRQIGTELDLTRRAIYDIRHKDSFYQFINEMIPKYKHVIDEFLTDENPNLRMKAAEEYGRMIRAATPRQIEQHIKKAEIKVILHGTPQPE